MHRHPKFSFQRLRGIISKEFLQMRRDRLTFAMMLGIPLIQLTLFGFAINSDPRHLPAAVLLADHGAQGRTLLYAMKNSTYFDFVREVKNRNRRARFARPRSGTVCDQHSGKFQPRSLARRSSGIVGRG